MKKNASKLIEAAIICSEEKEAINKLSALTLALITAQHMSNLAVPAICDFLEQASAEIKKTYETVELKEE